MAQIIHVGFCHKRRIKRILRAAKIREIKTNQRNATVNAQQKSV
jgi:hypothetical protein